MNAGWLALGDHLLQFCFSTVETQRAGELHALHGESLQAEERMSTCVVTGGLVAVGSNAVVNLALKLLQCSSHCFLPVLYVQHGS